MGTIREKHRKGSLIKKNREMQLKKSKKYVITKICASRESNPGPKYGKLGFYH